MKDKIIKNKPIPKRTVGTKPRSPQYALFKKMRVKDSIYFKTAKEAMKFTAVVRRGFGYGCVTSRKEGKGVRVWKIRVRGKAKRD